MTVPVASSRAALDPKRLRDLAVLELQQFQRAVLLYASVGLRALVQLGWDRVVEGAVEVGEADVDEDAGDVTSGLRRQPRP